MIILRSWRSSCLIAGRLTGPPAKLANSFLSAGVLRPETVWFLFIAKRKGYRLVNPGYFENLRARLAEFASQDPAMTVPGTRPETGPPDDPFRHAASLRWIVVSGRRLVPPLRDAIRHRATE